MTASDPSLAGVTDALAFLRASRRPTGGTAAWWAPLVGWSRAYPETTGYLIPTLIEAGAAVPDMSALTFARECAGWLRSIQLAEGGWASGLHPNRAIRPSIFNTAQILMGMNALRYTDGGCAEAGDRAARWLVDKLGRTGMWEGRDYRGSGTPSYYAHAFLPLVELAVMTGQDSILGPARRGLDEITTRVQPNGEIAAWGFSESSAAVTHTIFYTLYGILRSAEIMNDWKHYFKVIEPATERLLRASETRSGRLPGSYRPGWVPDDSFECLTGSCQAALCFTLIERNTGDIRYLSAAARLLERVRHAQSAGRPAGAPRGALPGSVPFWGPYMRFRWPTWTAKFFVDARLSTAARIHALAAA